MRRGGGERHLNKTLDPSHPPALRAAAATHHLPSSSAFAGRFTDDSLLPRIPAAGKVIGETHTRAHTGAHTHTHTNARLLVGWRVMARGVTGVQLSGEQAQVSGNHASLTSL